MGNLKQTIMTFAKAQASAGTATAIDFAVTLLLGKLFGWWYVMATFLGAVSGGVANCIINYQWVFHAKGQRKRSVAWRYMVVWSVSILLNTFGTYALTELTRGIDFIFIKALVAVLVAFFWNYQMQRTFVFHHHQDVAEDDSNEMDIDIDIDNSTLI